MAAPKYSFRSWLDKIIRRTASEKNIKIGYLLDEIGYAVGRRKSTIEYWRRGHIPKSQEEMVKLVTVLIDLGGLRDWDETYQFLCSANYTDSEGLLERLFPDSGYVKKRPTGTQGVLSLDSDPFIAGPALFDPRKFFGREIELKRVFGLLSKPPMQHAAILGSPRSGKTSLLHYLMMICTTPTSLLRPDQFHAWLENAEAYHWVYVDFHDPRMRKPEKLQQYILSQVGLVAPSNCTNNDFMDLIWGNITEPTILLLDEIDRAFDDLDQEKVNFWDGLRSLATHGACGNLGIILSTSNVNLFSPDYVRKSNSFVDIIGYTRELGPFTDAEAHELIASSPKPFTPQDISWIITTSKCWPITLQTLCLIRLMTLSESGDHWKDEGLEQIQKYKYLLDMSG